MYVMYTSKANNSAMAYFALAKQRNYKVTYSINQSCYNNMFYQTLYRDIIQNWGQFTHLCPCHLLSTEKQLMLTNSKPASILTPFSVLQSCDI